MIFFNLLMLTTVICFVIDVSGIVDSLESMLSRWRGKPCRLIKPFSCSMCMSFWIGLIYVLFNFSLFNLFMLTLIVTNAEQITNMLVLFRMLVNRVLDTIATYVEK